ncbi:hypothetical protein Dvul_2653 [Nitratidesulfovibrio vulgaris DP4]|uniref:Uncharacterized protein n=1 Tax=Nitratidesulfovibrio vulgaris (strain DP4) TaxID=391774 RepID=A0A0H3AB74_NITV4|nr:hypothetical protein Dvul_2653 [Nitratidesulfovibrio vulgaris DP4]
MRRCLKRGRKPGAPASGMAVVTGLRPGLRVAVPTHCGGFIAGDTSQRASAPAGVASRIALLLQAGWTA